MHLLMQVSRQCCAHNWELRSGYHPLSKEETLKKAPVSSVALTCQLQRDDNKKCQKGHYDNNGDRQCLDLFPPPMPGSLAASTCMPRQLAINVGHYKTFSLPCFFVFFSIYASLASLPPCPPVLT
jgi:hypothetical protein